MEQCPAPFVENWNFCFYMEPTEPENFVSFPHFDSFQLGNLEQFSALKNTGYGWWLWLVQKIGAYL